MTALAPSTLAELQNLVRGHQSLIIKGAETKTGLAVPAAASQSVIDVSNLRGITEYDPGEFTFTAMAGTSLKQIAATLAEHGQYLPFDPPLIEAGATLGGTVAAGLSGPGRLRYGGLRDFIIGVRFIDGTGKLIHGGGKVVKNAAGFDLPKLMVGSLGRLGLLAELTFKVFPRPRTRVTLQVDYPQLAEAIEAISRLTMAPLELDALELETPGKLVLRLAGEPDAMAPRTKRVEACLGKPTVTFTEDESRIYWLKLNEFHWAHGKTLVKVPTTPGRLALFDERLQAAGAIRHYSMAGNLTWVAWPNEKPLDELNRLLTELKLSGLVVLGITTGGRMGVDLGRPFAMRVKSALDPGNRFGELP